MAKRSDLHKQARDLLIAACYWVVIVPIAIVLRLTGRGRFPTPDPAAHTYFVSRRP